MKKGNMKMNNEQFQPEELNQVPKKEKQSAPAWALILIVLLVVALAVCGVILGKMLLGGKDKGGDKVASHHTNAHGYPSWSVHFRTRESDGNMEYYYLNDKEKEVKLSSDDVNTLMNKDVLTCGERVLNNRVLQCYYVDYTYAYYNQNMNSLYYSLDTSAPLDSQMQAETNTTWQQSFLEGSVNKANLVMALCQHAKDNGFTLTDEQQSEINMMTDLDMLSYSYGYEDGASLLAAMYGPMSTIEAYTTYVTDNITASYYTNQLAESVEVTDEEVEAYYDANADAMAAQNIEKIDKNVVNVRHILITPEAAEDGSISEEAWAAAEAEAQRVYDEWKAGEATEQTFSELAGTYTQDPGSKSTGGLYEDVYPGKMVTEFNDWCFDDARQVGDTGIVKTSYGFHVMFYSGQGDYIYWRDTCSYMLKSEKVTAVTDEILAQYQTKADYKNIIVLDATTATKPSTVQ